MKRTKNSLLPYYEKIDLSQRETFRVYVFPDNEQIRIEAPQFLIVSDNGHRIGCGEISHYVPYGWIHLWWRNKDERAENFYCESPEKERKAQ